MVIQSRLAHRIKLPLHDLAKLYTIETAAENAAMVIDKVSRQDVASLGVSRKHCKDKGFGEFFAFKLLQEPTSGEALVREAGLGHVELDASEMSDEDLVCPLSRNPFVDPVTLPCGATYSKAALVTRLDINGDACPHCAAKEARSNITPVKMLWFLRRLDRLQVRCSAQVDPCDWTGPRTSLVAHLAECSLSAQVVKLEEHSVTTDQKLRELTTQATGALAEVDSVSDQSRQLLELNNTLREENDVLEAEVLVVLQKADVLCEGLRGVSRDLSHRMLAMSETLMTLQFEVAALRDARPA
ncbi:hypothetical protein HKX48_005928 [Thoreauomyces humboldtii]|nr:hypothetical protein HKX48_005928 [Thoreauomyces humboldtii]